MKIFQALILSLTILTFSCSSPDKGESQEPVEKAEARGVEQSEEQIAVEINRLMTEQEEAWSSGDLEAFMQHYWQSDSLAFIGRSGVNHGWQTTLDNYRKSYPDKAAMGKLTFDNLSIEKLSSTHAYVIGKWNLERSQGDLSGHYSLVWKKIEGEWKIVSDHSS
ncbi:YybH family protein [Halocola ammonii]